MKLPTYQQMGFVSHPTVSPEQAAAPGKAMARFAEVASTVVGGIAGDMYEQEAASEYGRANAEIAQRADGLREFYLQTPNMTREQAGDLWQDEWAEAREVTTTNALGQEEAQMVETIPTWRISADHFDRELGNSYKEIEGNLRTRKAKNSFAETFHYELQPKWQGAADASQFAMSQAMRRAQSAEDGLKLQQQPDEKLMHDWAVLQVETGVVPPEKAAEFMRTSMEGWAVNSYTRDLLDENMPIDAREAMQGQLAEDPYLSEAKKQELTLDNDKAIWADNSNLVSGALLERDVSRMREMREYYRTSYEGSLEEGQVLTLVNRLSQGIDDLTVQSTFGDRVAIVNSRENVKNTIAGVENLDTHPAEIANLVDEPSMDFGGANQKPSDADIKARQKVEWLLDINQTMMNFHRMKPEERREYIDSFAGEDPASEYKREVLNNYSKGITEKAATNTTQYVIDQGLDSTVMGYRKTAIPPAPGEDPSEYASTLRTRTDLNNFVGDREGFNTGPLLPEEIQGHVREWGSANTAEKLDLLAVWGGSLGTDVHSMMLQFGPDGMGPSAYVASSVLLDPTNKENDSSSATVATRILNGAEAANDQSIDAIDQGVSDTYTRKAKHKYQKFFALDSNVDAAAQSMLHYSVGAKIEQGGQLTSSDANRDTFQRIYGDIADTQKGWGAREILTPGRGVRRRKFTDWLRDENIDRYIDDGMSTQLGKDPQYQAAKDAGLIYTGSEIRQSIEDGNMHLVPTPDRTKYYIMRTVGNNPGLVGLNGVPFTLKWDETYGD